MVIIVAAATRTKRMDGTPQHPGAMAQCSGSKFEQQDAWHKWQQEAQSRVHLGPHFAGFVAMSHIRLNIDAMKDLHNPSSVYRSVWQVTMRLLTNQTSENIMRRIETD